MKAQVLIVDDDPALRRALVDRLKHWGHEVREADTVEAAKRIAGEREFDLVLLDLHLPDGSGQEVLESLRADGHAADIVLLTAHGSIEAAVRALQAGATDFVQKPADFELLRMSVTRSLERRRLERVNRALQETGEESPGRAEPLPPLSGVMEMAKRAAQSNSTILLSGESGSGKQVMARFLHESSPRGAGPFVHVNCVAISDDLIESTLFGHERGAFTGAVARKPGRLEAAAGGTAFLDEIGDISPRLQAKLLHFLESGEFERIGGTRTVTVDCRIIAATHRDLVEGVRNGTFREDLYYRLNVIELRIPPLRERRADIPALVATLLRDAAHRQKRRDLTLDPAVLERLVDYHWPGNVRQLRNVIERMVVLAPGERLGPELLTPEIRGTAEEGESRPDDPPPGTLRSELRDRERELIAKALAAENGNQTRAAARLGVQRTWLNRRIRELDLASP